MRRITIAATFLLVAAAGCADHPAAPRPTEESAALLSDTEIEFLHCPSATDRSVTGTVGTLGGSLAVDGHRFTLPPLAIAEPTTFTMTAPASEYVELEIHAHGYDSFQFLLPAEIEISYDRCEHEDIEHGALSVWYIDGLTGELLEFMGGVADADARSVTFSSGHLSGFIIAN